MNGRGAIFTLTAIALLLIGMFQAGIFMHGD